MLYFFILIVTVAVASASFGAGYYWLKNRGVAPAPFEDPANLSPVARLAAIAPERLSRAADGSHETRQLLEMLFRLATGLSTHVDNHSADMHEISANLHSENGPVPSADHVISAIRRVVEANGRLNDQLHSAKSQLEDQARLLEDSLAQSLTDPLTKIANRRAMDLVIERAQAAWDHRKALYSLVLMDVDHFKRFNDTHGHRAGDAVLQSVAAVLSESTRKPTLVARYGGEEFALVMPGIDLDAAAAAADRARRAIESRTVAFEGKSLKVTASLGVAAIVDGGTVDDLIERSDKAVYASKGAGRNCVHVYRDGRCERFDPAGRAVVEEWIGAPPSSPLAAPASPAGGLAVEAPPVPAAGVRCLTRFEFIDMVRGLLVQAEADGRIHSVALLRLELRADAKEMHEQAMERAKELLHLALRTDDCLARYSDRVFALLLIDAIPSVAAEVLDRLIGRTRQGITQSLGVPCSLSVGIAGCERRDDTISLLRRAEQDIH